MVLAERNSLRSRFAFTWRGVKRPEDRELSLAGSESIVIDMTNGAVLGVLRNYVRTKTLGGSQRRVWWLNAVSCANIPEGFQDNLGQQLYGFVSTVLRPIESK